MITNAWQSLNIKCLAVVYKYISELTIVDCKNRPKPLYFIFTRHFFVFVFIYIFVLCCKHFCKHLFFSFSYNGFEYIFDCQLITQSFIYNGRWPCLSCVAFLHCDVYLGQGCCVRWGENSLSVPCFGWKWKKGLTLSLKKIFQF